MKLCMQVAEVGLGRGHIVLDGGPCSLTEGAQQPTALSKCGPRLLQPNGWMDEDATW